MFSLCFLNITYTANDVNSIISSPVYVKSDEFVENVKNSITDVFSYAALKISFENNGKIAYDKTIAETSSEKEAIRKWSIDDFLKIAKAHGLYIDTDYTVKIDETKRVPFSKNDKYNILLKTYPSLRRTGETTEEEFITEFMNSLATYNRCKNNFITNSPNFEFLLTFAESTNMPELTFSNTSKKNQDFLTDNAFVYISNKDSIVTSNIPHINANVTKSYREINPYPNRDYTFYCSVDTTFPHTDNYRIDYDAYNKKKDQLGSILTISIISLISFIITLFISLFSILSTKKEIDENKRFFHTLPTEFFIIIYIVLNIAMIQYANFYIDSRRFASYDLSNIRGYIYVLILYCNTLLLTAILSTKYANNTLLPEFFTFISEKNAAGNKIKSPVLTFLLVLLPLILFFIISFYIIYLYVSTSNKLLLLVGCVLLATTIGFAAYLFTLYSTFNATLKAHSDAVNLRSSLITNVTHDIKTPLTSILSYADLISTEVKNPTRSYKKNLSHYTKVINEKTNRLNSLINDLIYDNKASNGAINYDLKRIDMRSFLKQIVDEFKDRLMNKRIKIVFTHDNNKAFILADNNHLYRVFQNLFSNIYKYALEKTRVYMDLVVNRKTVIVTIRNIQKDVIEVNTNTLKNRFVRGNVSRTTEGFGLGLSIAENLVKGMNGKLDIKSVRDEFIAKVTFLLDED